MPKIIDCFLFRDELEILELRIKYLYPYVDHFVIISGSHSFQGKLLANPLALFPEKLKPYGDKITSYRVPLSVGAGLDSWSLEREQRNGSIPAVNSISPNDNDIVILSDIDEIWFSSLSAILRALMQEEKNSSRKLLIEMWDSYFSAEVIQDAAWNKVFAMPWGEFRKIDPFDERNNPGEKIIAGKSGWHLTYCGGLEKIIKKQNTFAHVEFKNTKYVSPQWLEHCINTLSDPYERDINWRKMTYQELSISMEPKLLNLLLTEFPQFISTSSIAEHRKACSA